MAVEFCYKGNILIVRLKGELDLHTVTTVRDKVENELTRSGLRILLVNLAGVTFMDSSGLGFILGRYRRLCEQGGSMLLCAPVAQVRRVLELSGVNHIMRIITTESEAAMTGERG